MTVFLKKIIILLAIGVCISYHSNAQLQITNVSGAQQLVDMLLGQGITVSNVTLTGTTRMAGIFRNVSGTNINIDSGIVLTNGLAKSDRATGKTGMDGDGVTTAGDADAFNRLGLPGDVDLSAIVNDDTNDACVLEFDFVPLGDSIKFNYVFSSEEYTFYSCTNFNDVFAFFISGPGIIGLKNIALIPGTNTPVTINNINTHACALYPQYYVDNLTNKNFTYDGHIKVFTALERVQPCQTYHLKLAIADVSDDDLDSGVFLEAKSLSSNVVTIKNLTQTDLNNKSYLVEGCSTGAFKLRRPEADPSPLDVMLSYGGTATSGVDYQVMPLMATIPANSPEVTIDVLPIIDNLPEGVETIVIYASPVSGCAVGIPTDSTIIQIRDYDTLGIVPDTLIICKGTSVQLTATPGYISYQWDPDPTLSNLAIRNPMATPVNTSTTYYCTATEGTCHGRDSAWLVMKKLDFVSKQEINCKNAATGEIQVNGSPGWVPPVQYNINNGPLQPSGTFSNLPVGTYTVKITDATGCLDSLVVNITQLYPDLVIPNALVAAATCSGFPDGSATIIANGGNPPYKYSTDGINFQNSNVLDLTAGSYTITVMDNNGCLQTKTVSIPFYNPLVVNAGADISVCEGKSGQLNATSNGSAVIWWPAIGLSDPTILNPVVTPGMSTEYHLTATLGTLCLLRDTVIVLMNAAPKPNAGADQTICFGTNTTLSASGGTQFFWTPSSYLNNTHVAAPIVKMPPGKITYTLNVIDGNGCASLAPDQVTVNVTREEKIFAGNDTTLAIGQPLTLQPIDVSGSAYTQYEWIPHDGLSDPFIANPIALPDRNMWYTVLARTALGCTARDDIKVTVYKGPDIYVPQAFTPNADGTNDILRAVPVGIASFHYFRLYDRWGKMLFQTTEPSFGWDGKLGGTYQPLGTYVWMAEGVDYRGNVVYKKGTVIIVK